MFVDIQQFMTHYFHFVPRQERKKEAHPIGCASLVGEAGLEPARPQ